MTINPYEPPQVPRSAAEAVPETDYGPWHHHGVLVVDVHHLHMLPRRCVLTGVDVADNETRRMTVYYPGANPSETSVAFAWPLSRAARLKWRWCDFVAWGAILLGTSSVVCYIGIESQRSSFWRTPVELLLGGSASALFGFILLYLYDWRPLSLHRREGRFAWILGVHPRFLESLPPWPGEAYE